jgi:hypothetical protein
MKREIIHVDADGRGPDGDDFTLTATQEAVQAGLMVNVAVTCVFPDGRRLDTTQARITPVGMAVLQKHFGQGGNA